MTNETRAYLAFRRREERNFMICAALTSLVLAALPFAFVWDWTH